MSKIKNFVIDLKRRKVFRVASVYAVTAWAVSLGAAELFPAFGIPEWAVRLVVFAAILGLPVAVVLAWAFEVTPTGIVLEEPLADAGSEMDSATTHLSTSRAVTVSWIDDGRAQQASFSSSFTVGRDKDCEISLNDDKVSRRHARIYFHLGQWLVEDLASRNGTFLDAELVSNAPLHDASALQLSDGGPVLRVNIGNDDETQIAG